MTAAPRIFISYRTADGVDKATALARELNAVFGADQVFLDKEDLPAGQPWREAVGATLDARPVLLLLVTPQTFAARDAQGRPRIDDPTDPVRREVETALDAKAHLIPLLADGVEQLPDAPSLPEALRGLGERTWRRLRAYDWAEDIERLVADLQALGLKRLERSVQRREADRRRWLEWGLAFVAGTASGGTLVAWWPARAPAGAAGLTGTWSLTAAPPANDAGSRYEKLRLHLTHSGEEVKLYSDPIATADDPVWKAFAAQWKERFDTPLDHVVWRGAGRVRMEQGAPLSFDAELRVERPQGSDKPIEGGRLVAELAPGGDRMSGALWMNGEQAERTMEMTRER